MLLPLIANAQQSATAKTSSSEQAVIHEVRKWSYDNYTRVVIYADRKLTHVAKELPADAAHQKPPRIYVDLKNARLAPNVEAELSISDGLLTKARIAQFDKQTARLVLDLESLASFQVVPFRDPDRLVIDVFGKQTEQATIEPQIKKPAEVVHDDAVAAILDGGAKKAPAQAPSSEKTAKLATKPSIRKQKVIVIDAGHGGKDPGAIGYKGIQEKDIVLSIAKMVADRLRKDGHKVIETRTSDVFLELPERTFVANKEDADLFVSIHANSNKNKSAYGIETYHLSKTSDERALELARRENAMLNHGEFDALEELLGALNFSNKLNVSRALAQFIQGNLSQVIGKQHPSTFKNLGAKGGPFYVLIGTHMAAVLVEVGFVTNPQEGKLLASSAYQKKLADGIVAGINEYLSKLSKIPI